MTALISAKNAYVRYGASEALSDVSLALHPSEIVTVVGPNGAGKSTLVQLMVGALRAHSGTVERSQKLRLGYVPQSLHLDGQIPLRVDRFLKLNPNSDDAQTQIALAQSGAEKLVHKEISGLSGGELKRVLLAFALSSHPNLLVLDEPTAGLDQPAMIDFYALIEKLRDELNLAVLLISHDLNIVMRASDRVICLNRHICCQGTPDFVSNAPEFQALFGQNNAPVTLYKHQHNHSHDDGVCDHE